MLRHIFDLDFRYSALFLRLPFLFSPCFHIAKTIRKTRVKFLVKTIGMIRCKDKRGIGFRFDLASGGGGTRDGGAACLISTYPDNLRQPERLGAGSSCQAAARTEIDTHSRMRIRDLEASGENPKRRSDGSSIYLDIRGRVLTYEPLPKQWISQKPDI